MKLEVGKRYVRRNGTVTAPLELAQHNDPEDQLAFPFFDPDRELTYSEDGSWLLSESRMDLVREYEDS